MGWIDDVKGSATVATVAADLGLETRGRNLAACPACGVAKHGSGKVHDHGSRWHCFRCNVGGDAVDLVAYRLTGARLGGLTGDRMAEVRAYCADRGWCLPEGEQGHRIRPPTPPPVPVPPKTPAPRPRPPGDELVALWDACVPVTDDEAVQAWLVGRRFDPDRVAELDLARALPRGLDLPRWAWFKGKPWNRGPWRCLFPAWGPTGRMESLRARAAMQDIPPGDKAGAAAAGEGSATGLLLADAGGRVLLETGKAPTWWPEGQPLQVVVVEGETDFLSRATLYGDAAEDAPPVLGLWSGAWTDELARRIPDGAQVVIRTDNNPAGDRYAKRVCATLAGRCDLFRKSQPKGDP